MISIVVALPAEARPIVERFGLKRDRSSGQRIYRAEETRLIVSGVGARASAIAVERLAGGAGRGPGAWINFGIAGHRDARIGTVRLANRIVDATSGDVWYPPAPFSPPCDGATVCTVAGVERRPPDDALYEMEAAGFYRSALRNATAELVQVLKVVSDNSETPPERLTAAAVEKLIEQSLPDVEALIAELAPLAASLEARAAAPVGLVAFRERWRFTVTQERQLRRLLRRLETLGRPVAAEAIRRGDSAAAVLAELREQL